MARLIDARRMLVFTAAALAVASGPAAGRLHGQSLGYAETSGRVQAAGGSPVAGALLTLRDGEGRAVEQRRSGRDGSFRFAYLEEGLYQLVVEELGYRPVHVRGLGLERGARVELTVTLETAAPAEAAPVTVEVGGARAPGAGAAGSLDRRQLTLLPFPARDAGDLHLEHTRATEISVEGLPLGSRQVRVGGWSTGTGVAGAAPSPPHVGLAVDALSDAAWRGRPDVEFDAPTGVALDLGLRRGSGAGGRVAGLVGRPGALNGDVEAATDALFHGSYDARSSGGAGFFGGVEWRRLAAPLSPSPEVHALSVGVTEAAAQQHGLVLDPAGAPRETDVLAMFGRLDLPSGNAGHLRLHALGSIHSVAGADRLTADEPDRGSGTATVALDYSAPVSRGLFSETRVGLAYGKLDDDDAVVPTTIGPLRLGSGGPGETRSTLSASQAFHATRGDHRLKAGASLDYLRIEGRVDPIPGPDFRFADAGALGVARGFYAGSPGGGTQAEASLPRFAFFGQDVWQLSPSFRLLAGARVVLDVLPAGDIDLEERWYFATGMANTAIDDVVAEIEPRLAFDWRPGGSSGIGVFGSIGLYTDRPDPRALLELIGNNGSLRVRRVEGDLSWPGIPGAGAGDRVGLTVPGSTFRGPRTVRFQAGLLRPFATGRIGIEAVARHTDRLLTRRNVHRRSTPAARDQYGRAIWAPLVAVDGLLGSELDWAVVPEFDHVWMLGSDATSTFYAATVFASMGHGGPIMLNGSYTLSRTRDTWPSAGSLVGSAPPPGFVNSDLDETWTDGVSDYDVPHNALVEALYTVPLATRPVLALRYRFRSGFPFTPGYTTGLDYNGDGLGGDPAHIDAQLPGMGALLSEWECLREGAGQVAPRNSCRSDPLHALDASLHLELVRDRAVLTLEALGLLASELGPIDAALYRLAPGGEPEQSGSIVAIPLSVNPGFGSVLVDRNPGATLRLGLRVAL